MPWPPASPPPTTSRSYVFIDSDSQVVPDSVNTLVEYFSDPRVGAVADTPTSPTSSTTC